MNREEARKAAEVMLAYANGKEIERSRENENDWMVADNPIFDWSCNDYRIRHKPKYRPFNSTEECWKEMRKHTPFGWVQDKDDSSFKQYTLLVNKDGVRLNGYDDDTLFLSYKSLFDFCTFVDGTPLGIKE